MARLFDEAMKTPPADSAFARLVYVHLLERLTNGDLNAAMGMFGDPGTRTAATKELHSMDRAQLEKLT